MFLDNSNPERAFRLETSWSTSSISATASQQLCCYLITKFNFQRPSVPTRADIHSVSNAIFLEKASEHTIKIYQHIMRSVESRYGPVIKLFEIEGSTERRLVIGYKMGRTARFFR